MSGLVGCDVDDAEGEGEGEGTGAVGVGEAREERGWMIGPEAGTVWRRTAEC